jgi:hypothetical protein
MYMRAFGSLVNYKLKALHRSEKVLVCAIPPLGGIAQTVTSSHFFGQTYILAPDRIIINLSPSIK